MHVRPAEVRQTLWSNHGLGRNFNHGMKVAATGEPRCKKVYLLERSFSLSLSVGVRVCGRERECGRVRARIEPVQALV